jgi:hypothetical protein
MDPVTAASAASTAATAGETASVSASAAEANVSAASMAEVAEATSEATEVLLGEKGLIEQLDTIHHSSLESVAARNEVAIKELSPVEINHIMGDARAEIVGKGLEKTYPKEQGYNIESEIPLRNQDGTLARDPVMQEASGLEGTRRLDFVVIKDGQVIRSVEVTSESAPKDLQMAKEERIRATGGNFVLDRTTGELVPFAPTVRTEVIRRA